MISYYRNFTLTKKFEPKVLKFEFKILGGRSEGGPLGDKRVILVV
jgi:hypothetical protein